MYQQFFCLSTPLAEIHGQGLKLTLVPIGSNKKTGLQNFNPVVQRATVSKLPPFVFFNFDIYLMYMKIGINASFLRKQNTGIGQVSANFLKELVEFSSTKLQIANNKEFEFVLYLEEDTDLGLLGDIAFSKVKFQKKVFLPKHYKRDDLFRKIWWEKVLLPKKVNQDDCDVLLSLYQCPTSLNKNKKKIKHIMIVHDIIPKLFPTYLNNWRKKAYQRLTEKAISKADKIIAVSHRTEKDLIQHLGIDAGKN